MAQKITENLVMENVRLIYRNFAGREGTYNRQGDRNFAVVIEDPDFAQKLIEDGWNVHAKAPKNPGDEPFYYLPVTVKFNRMPPKIVSITRRKKKLLDEENVETLDHIAISNADVCVRPYNWETNGKTGVKAYLKTLYVTLVEDEFAAKYAEEECPDDDEVPW